MPAIPTTIDELLPLVSWWFVDAPASNSVACLIVLDDNTSITCTEEQLNAIDARIVPVVRAVRAKRGSLNATTVLQESLRLWRGETFVPYPEDAFWGDDFFLSRFSLVEQHHPEEQKVVLIGHWFAVEDHSGLQIASKWECTSEFYGYAWLEHHFPDCINRLRTAEGLGLADHEQAAFALYGDSTANTTLALPSDVYLT